MCASKINKVAIYTLLLAFFRILDLKYTSAEENCIQIKTQNSAFTGSMQLRFQLGYSFSILEELFTGEY